MLLIDRDSKPEDTILYISAQLAAKLKDTGKVKVAFIEQVYNEVDSQQPVYKYNLSLNFLFLVGKVKIEDGDLIYVS